MKEVKTTEENLKTVKDATLYLKGVVPGLFNDNFLAHFDSVLSAVTHTIIKHVPGYQISDKFIWKSVIIINNSVVKHMSFEFNNAWTIVYDFLYEHIGIDVEKEIARIEQHRQELDEIRKKNHFIAVWSISKKRDEIFSFNDVYPVHIKKLSYTSNSGAGHPCSMIVPEGATYFDIWKLADNLIRISEDHHHCFIEGINGVDALNMEYELRLGS